MPNKYGNARIVKEGIPHGTTTGYWRERNRGLPVCDDCKEAWNIHCSKYRLQTKRIRYRLPPRGVRK